MQDIYLYKKAKAILNIKDVQEITEHLNLLSCYNINNEIVFTKKQMDYNFIDTIEELIKFMYPNDSILNITQNDLNDKIEFEIELEIDTKLRTIEFLKVYTFNDTDFYKLNIDDFRFLNNNPFSFVEKLDQIKEPTKEEIKNIQTLIFKYFLYSREYTIYKIEGELFYDNPHGDNFISHNDLLDYLNYHMLDDGAFISDLWLQFKELRL